MAVGVLVIGVGLVVLLMVVGICIAVGVDARRRGLEVGLAVAVGLVALLTFPLGPLLWLLLRERLVPLIGSSEPTVP